MGCIFRGWRAHGIWTWIGENDLTLKDFAELTDVFYIGGTKCGALFGEALIITAQDLKYRFKAYMKQNGAVLAKGWLMGLQFATMLESGEYFEAAKRADALAMQIKKAFEDKGVPFAVESFTNQQFVILTEQQKQELAQNIILKTKVIRSVSVRAGQQRRTRLICWLRTSKSCRNIETCGA